MWNKIKSILKKENFVKIKACDIYKTLKEYKIVTLSTSDTGLFLADVPTFILPITISKDELSNKIFSSLNSSRCNVPFPNSKVEMQEFQKKHLKDLKEKSFKSLYKNSINCSIRLENNILEITPSRFEKYYLEPVSEKSVKIEYNNNELEITKIIIDILNKK